MADYYPLIARAITALDPSAPGESRRVIYERARTALIAQLRGVQPPLSDSEIIRERLALEEAVRKVEAEASQRSRESARQGGPRAARGQEASPPPQGSAASQQEGRQQQSYPPREREREREPQPRRPPQPQQQRPSTGRGFRDAPPPDADEVGYAQNPQGQAGRSTRRSFANAPQPEFEQPRPNPRREGRGRPYADEPVHENEFDTRLDMQGRSRSGFPFKIMITIAVLLILTPIVGFLWGKPFMDYWQRPPVDKQHEQASKPQKETERFEGKLVQERAVLLLEDVQVQKVEGTVSWRFEPGNSPSEGVVHAVIDFPERKLKVQLKLERNTEPSLPASHTAELSFITPPDSPSGGVEGMGNIVMKTSEDEVGAPSLAGSVVSVTSGLFLVGLTESMRTGNLQLIKNRAWLEIPITFANKQRALISIEKGASGDRVLNEAFAKWGD